MRVREGVNEIEDGGRFLIRRSRRIPGGSRPDTTLTASSRSGHFSGHPPILARSAHRRNRDRQESSPVTGLNEQDSRILDNGKTLLFDTTTIRIGDQILCKKNRYVLSAGRIHRPLFACPQLDNAGGRFVTLSPSTQGSVVDSPREPLLPNNSRLSSSVLLPMGSDKSWSLG